MTPRTQALAYRIWAYCEPRGWDCTPPEIAEAIGSNPYTVRNILVGKGWASRVRTTKTADIGTLWNQSAFRTVDDALDGVWL